MTRATPSPESTVVRKPAAATPPSEATIVHTRILRCMLAVDDSYAYWRNVDPDIPTTERARVAFERRWFGTKSEARIRTIMTDMTERFDAYPEALTLLQRLPVIPAALRPFICHVHTQLADPIYRAFSGHFLAVRRDEGYRTIDREAVARWIDLREPNRWSPASRIKFGANLLATAGDAGLVAGRRDPRKLTIPSVPDVAVGYALYLLRTVKFEGTLTDNPYLRSLAITPETFRTFAPRIPGITFAELGGVVDLTFQAPSLLAWGLDVIGGAA